MSNGFSSDFIQAQSLIKGIIETAGGEQALLNGLGAAPLGSLVSEPSSQLQGNTAKAVAEALIAVSEAQSIDSMPQVSEALTSAGGALFVAEALAMVSAKSASAINAAGGAINVAEAMALYSKP